MQRHPDLPEQKTPRQVDMIRQHFESGGSLTTLEAVRLYGVMALSQRCGDLERSGFPLRRERVTLENGKNVVRYSAMFRTTLTQQSD